MNLLFWTQPRLLLSDLPRRRPGVGPPTSAGCGAAARGRMVAAPTSLPAPQQSPTPTGRGLLQKSMHEGLKIESGWYVQIQVEARCRHLRNDRQRRNSCVWDHSNYGPTSTALPRTDPHHGLAPTIRRKFSSDTKSININVRHFQN